MRVGVGLDRAGSDVIGAQQRLARQEGRLPPLGADAQDGVRLPIEHGAERPVRVGEVEQRHVAERLEGQQPRRTVSGLQRARRQARPRRDRQELHEVTAGDQ